MKLMRVYVDTSVIGGCCDTEFAQWSNGLFKDFEAGVFTPVVSDVVSAEIADAPDEVVQKYSQLLLLNPQFVQATQESQELAATYVSRNIVGPKYSNDALHIALATVAHVDVLVGWNFKHIVRLDAIRLFNAVNQELGYGQLQIYSPREVTHHDD